MNRVLPFPFLSLGLLLMWLLLHGSTAPAVLVSGIVVAVAAPWILLALEVERLRLGRIGAAFKLVAIVLHDIVRSNLAVASIIYGKRRDTRASGFVVIPVDMRNRYGLTLLAVIVTCTPGTLWVQYDSARSRLLMHIFDLVAPEHWVTLVKQRYERLLLEIFE